MPRHKGKIESGVKFAQANALKGRQFDSLAAENAFLTEWERTVADTRIHGTIRQQVGTFFTQAEQPKLQALPATLFPCFVEAKRTVHRDGHVAYDQAYYSAPPEYVGREVWARWDGRIVRLFNLRFEQIAVHARAEDGRFRTHDGHIHQRRLSAVERGEDWMFKQIRLVGPHTEAWAHAVISERGIQGLRTLQGLLALTRHHRRAAIEEACHTAAGVGMIRLRDLKRLLERPQPDQPTLEFLDDHPLIRPTRSYALVAPFPQSRGMPAAAVPTCDGLSTAALPILAGPAAAGVAIATRTATAMEGPRRTATTDEGAYLP
jgi:hypothetical protein